MDGIQLWVALPRECEELEPDFSHHATAELPAFEEHGARLRLIAGEAFGRRSPVRVHSPLCYLHCDIAPGAEAAFAPLYPERAAYVVSGAIEIEGAVHEAGTMLVLAPGSVARMRAPRGATAMLLGGEAIGERFIEWNFVSSSRERIEQAKADWRAGRMKLPDQDNSEFIPLPLEPGAAPNPMS